MVYFCSQIGNVGIWCPDDTQLREGLIHHAAITCLEWNPNGNRLVTGDQEGGIVVWKIDSRRKLTIMSKYRLQATIQHILFKLPTKRVRESRFCSIIRTKKEDNPPFFIADVQGGIYFADDVGHCAESIITGSKINLMYQNELKDMLVVLGDDFVLSNYIQSADGKLASDTSVYKV